jgi:hypothetical protein
MKLSIVLSTFAIVLPIACTTSSKPDSSGTSNTEPAAVAAAPVTTPDTTVKTATVEAPSEVVEYPSYLPWEYTFYGISNTTPAVAAFVQSGRVHNDAQSRKGELEFYVVDVEKNNYVTMPYFDFAEDKQSEAAQRDIKGILKQYNLPDTEFKKTSLSSASAGAPVMINDQEHSLKLLQTSADGKLIFELQLINLKTGQGWLLQKDKMLPASRGEVTKYALKDAYVRGDKIAVIIRYDRIGGITNGKEFKLGKFLIVTGSVGITPSL